MTNKSYHDLRCFVALILAVVTCLPFLSLYSNADTTTTEKLRYYLGETVKVKKDNGYSEEILRNEKDFNYGWELGHFYVEGYTRAITEKDNTPIFMKNVGDEFVLYFTLDENIDQLDGNEQRSIAEDPKGFDTYFGVEKTNFGRGTVIIRHTNYQNLKGEPVIYTNYLSAVGVGADTKVEVFEEGDYEVALNYKIKNDPRNVLGVSILPKYEDYRIFFKFSIRNGNCMVFPMDVKTNMELMNKSMTENGFYLDLAKSRYLDINVKKEVLKEGVEGLVEDVRFNGTAKEGDMYIDEGIYTITVQNRYTDEKTTKKIYVGTDNVLKAHVVTGYSIEEINNKIAMGASINDDGTLKLSSNNKNVQNQEIKINKANDREERSDDKQKTLSSVFDISNLLEQRNINVFAGGSIVVLLFIIIGLTWKKRK